VASSYLKAMQLSKQLEEKAKEEKKNRQLAEEELQKVEDMMHSAKASDIEVVDAEKYFVEATAAFKDKNYRDALSLITKSSEQLKTNSKESIQGILDSVISLADMGKDIGADCSAGLALLEESKDHLNKGDFERSIGLAKESWEAFEKIAQEHLSESFSSAQSMIVLARNSGEDVSNSEDLLEEARKNIEAQEYSIAFTRLKECLESVGSGISTQVEELLDEAKGYQITAKELNADISRVNELVTRTEEEIKTGDLEAALSSARLSKSEAEKTISRAISTTIEDMKSSLLEAEKIDAEIEKAVEHLDIANVAHKNGKYLDSINALKDCETEIENAQFQRVLHTISQSRSKFIVANKVGADLDEAVGFLNEAREALKEGRYRDALEMAEKGDSVVEQLVKEFQEIEDTIAALEDQINSGKKRGLELNVPESSLMEAKDALESRDFETVTIYVKKTRDEINSAIYSYATDCIETAELVISAGDKLGANLEEPEQLLKTAISETKEGNFQKAIEMAEDGTSKAEEIIKIHVSNTIASAELAIYDAENVDIDEINTLINNAKREFENYAFDNAFEYADKALTMLETAQSGKAREQHRKMEGALVIAKRMGCDVASVEETSRKCQEYMNNRDFATATLYATKGHDEAVNLQYVAAERMFGEAKLSAIEAKKLGIDITDMREALKRAKQAFSQEDFEKTYKESKNAKNAAERQVDQHQSAYDAITQAAAMIAEAKKNQAEVKSVMATLSTAKSMFEHFDYENARKEAEKAKGETENLLKQYEIAKKLDIVLQNLQLLDSLENIDLTELRNKVEDTQTSLKNKELDNASSLAEDCDRTATQMLESGVTDLLTKAGKIVMDATDVGIDVTEQSTRLEDARRSMQALKFEETIKLAKDSMKEVAEIKELSQRAAVEIKLAQGALNEGEGLHADMDKAKEFMGNALSELKSAKYDEAIQFASKSTTEARKAIEDFITETIKTVKVGIEKAKMDGTTVTAAERLMDQATVAFNDKDYKTAIGLALKSEGELEKVGLQQEMAEKAIHTAVTKLEDAKKRGMHSSKAVSLLEGARKEATKGEYVKALEHAIQSGDELHGVSEEYNEAKDTLDLLQSQIDIADKISAEVSIAKKLMTDAKGAMSDNDYKTTTEIAKEGIIEARRLSHAKLNSDISEAYKLSDLASKYDINVSGVSPVLAEAKTFMGSGKFEISAEKITYCLDDIKDKLKTHIMDVIDQSERSMAHAKEMGADITESERLLTSAKMALEAGKFKDALNQADKSKQAVDLKKGFEREFIELTYEVEKVISNSKKFGINMKEAEELFTSARAQKQSNYQAAISTLKNSIEVAKTAVDDFRPRLKADIVLDKVEKDAWTETEITIRNEGKSLAKDIKFNIIGDISFEGQSTLESLRGGGGEEKLMIKMKFGTLGDIPVIIKLSSTRIMDGKTFTDESIDNVLVSEPGAVPAEPKKIDAAAAFQKMKATAETKCNICMGKVKAGLDIIKCNCGKDFHAMCGTRAGKCPGCGTEFVEKAEDDVGIDDLEVPTRPINNKPSEPPAEEKKEEPPTETQPPEAPAEEKKEEEQPKKKRLALKF